MSYTTESMAIWDDYEDVEPIPQPVHHGPFYPPELDAEPDYGRCARCGREGEVWYVNREWVCEQHAEDA